MKMNCPKTFYEIESCITSDSLSPLKIELNQFGFFLKGKKIKP